MLTPHEIEVCNRVLSTIAPKQAHELDQIFKEALKEAKQKEKEALSKEEQNVEQWLSLLKQVLKDQNFKREEINIVDDIDGIFFVYNFQGTSFFVEISVDTYCDFNGKDSNHNITVQYQGSFINDFSEEVGGTYNISTPQMIKLLKDPEGLFKIIWHHIITWAKRNVKDYKNMFDELDSIVEISRMTSPK